ncbi:MAG: AAA family ATPase [Gemmatimonadaceae bacterium]|nr:AAA family ATPase [Gemmatimonadaceae bacterium]
MDFPGFIEELELLVRSRYALVVIDTWEIDRAAEAVRHVAARLSLHHHEWSRSRGVSRGTGVGAPMIDETAAPIDALRHIEREGSGLFHLPLLGAFLDAPEVVAWVHEVLERFRMRRGALVISGRDVRLPESLRQHAIVVRLPAPSAEEYRDLLERVIREHTARMPVRVELEHESRARLLHNLFGLSLIEAEKILTRLLMADGVLSEADIARIAIAKRQAVEQDGLLEYWTTGEGLSQVAGLDGLKRWLGKRRASVSNPDRAAAFGLPFPKGILLTGVPGCGKSLSAKAVAHEWQLPLLRLDPGALFNKYVGDTEKNFRRALATAERMAPIVLWIDELEKAFASSGDQDGGVSQRVLGGFLSWLQERRGDVFVVATSNDVTRLPPEFIRKGRFDEVFFVDLPNVDARRALFELHLRRRRQDPGAFDLAALARSSSGFSGAEVEQVIVSALFEAFARGAPLSSDLLRAELGTTRPLSETMAERLAALREWASERTVNADGPVSRARSVA